jgi:hypothetical protein
MVLVSLHMDSRSSSQERAGTLWKSLRMNLEDVLSSAKALRKERLREIENQRSVWLEQEHERLEQGRSGAPGSDERHALRLEKAKEKIDAWHRRQLEKVDQHYRSKVERARERDLAKRAHRWMGRRPREERRPTERRPTERRPTERRPTERSKDVERRYKAVRRAIAQYCTGVKGALSPRAAECLQAIFFHPGRRHRLARWLKGRQANICNLSEAEYERLRGQKVLRVDEEDGRIMDPVAGADCSLLEVSGAAPATPATWIQWGQDVVRIAAATGTSWPRHVARLVRSPLGVPLAVLHKINPLLVVPVPRPLSAAATFAGDMLLRYLLTTTPATGATLFALDGLYLWITMLPEYAVRHDCVDSAGLHPVPAAHMAVGSLASSLIIGSMFGALLAMTAGQTGLTVPFLGSKVGEAMRAVANRKDLGTLSTALTMGAGLAASRTMGGQAAVAALTEMLKKVAYGTLFQLKEAGYLADSKVAKMLAAFAHTVTGGNLGGEVQRVLDLLAEVGGGLSAAEAANMVRKVGKQPVDYAGELDAIRDFISTAAHDIANLVVGEEKKLVTKEGASTLYEFFRGTKDKIGGGVRSAVLHPYDTATGAYGAAAAGAERARNIFTPEGAAAELGNLSNLLPPYFAGGAFASLVAALKEHLDCVFARLLYSWHQRRRHKKWAA